MQTGNTVIIHKSPIIQQGLKSILLARNIGISDVLTAVPDCLVLQNWKDLLVLVDTQYCRELLKHSRILRKNGNMLVGIESSGHILDVDLEQTLFIDDSTDTIVQKLNGYISKISDSKIDNQLSVREIEILGMVAQGFSNKQIAEQLFISIHTVITHRKNITSKLGIKSISGLTLYAALNNFI